MTTDKHPAYTKAIRWIVGRKVLHRHNQYLNNRIEQNHRLIKQRYYPDLPQIVVPVAMLVPDASSEVCARHRDVVCSGQSSQLVLVADSPTNCAA
jgi:hypothetical protein